MSWYVNTTDLGPGNNGPYPVGVFEMTGQHADALNRLILDGADRAGLHGPFATRADAEAFLAANPVKKTTTTQQIDKLSGGIPGLPSIAGAIEGWFVRAAEVIAGVVLLAIAANVVLKRA